MYTTFDSLEYVKGAEKVGIKREHAEYEAQQLVKLVSNDNKELNKALRKELKEMENRLIIRLGGLIVVCSGVIMSLIGFIK